MIESLVGSLQVIFVSYGVFGIMVASFLEEVFWFIPSSLIQMSFGFFLFQGVPFTVPHVLEFLIIVCLPASIGTTIGTLPFYFLTYYGGRPIFDRYGKKIGIRKASVEKAEKFLSEKKFGHGTLFIARALPFIPNTTITLVFGFLRVKLIPYLLYTFLGIIVRVLIFGIIGWQFGIGYEALLKLF